MEESGVEKRLSIICVAKSRVHITVVFLRFINVAAKTVNVL